MPKDPLRTAELLERKARNAATTGPEREAFLAKAAELRAKAPAPPRRPSRLRVSGHGYTVHFTTSTAATARGSMDDFARFAAEAWASAAETTADESPVAGLFTHAPDCGCSECAVRG